MEFVYEEEGTVQQNIGAMIAMIVGVGIATLVLIFVGTLGGATYNQVETDINNINDTTIKSYVKDSITSSFQALKTTGDYLPLIVLATVIFLILGMVMSLGIFGGYGGYYYRGGAL